MRLRSFRVNGLFGIYDHSISFNEEGLTYIHSVNGVGKSTALGLLCDVFSGNIQGLERTMFDTSEAEFDDGTVVKVSKNGKNVSFAVDGKESAAAETDVLYDVLYLSTDRNTVCDNNMLRPAVDALAAEFRNLYREMSENAEIMPGDGSEYGSMSGEEFVDFCRDLKARMDFISDIGIHPKLPAEYEFPPIRADFDDDMAKYHSIAAGISAWTEKNYAFAESASGLLYIMNDLFTDKRIEITENGFEAEIGRGRHIPISALSSGEKQIFIMFYQMLFHAKRGSLVVIDEPELSLHISWQQKLGEMFLEMHRIRGLDILASTHSPSVIHDRWDLAQELSSDNA